MNNMGRDAKDVTEATNIILSDVIRQSAHSLTGAAEDYDPLMKLIGDAHFVLLGEASHGAMSSIASARRSQSA